MTISYLSSIYEKDFLLWLEETAKILREGKLHELDLPNLIEEIESMGRSEKSALESNLVILLIHLLKWKYQSEKRTNSWIFSIDEHQIRIIKALKNSPSLKRYFQEVFEECYQDARKRAAKETNLPLNTFPLVSPFTPQEVLDEDFLPQED